MMFFMNGIHELCAVATYHLQYDFPHSTKPSPPYMDGSSRCNE